MSSDARRLLEPVPAGKIGFDRLLKLDEHRLDPDMAHEPPLAEGGAGMGGSEMVGFPNIKYIVAADFQRVFRSRSLRAGWAIGLRGRTAVKISM